MWRVSFVLMMMAWGCGETLNARGAVSVQFVQENGVAVSGSFTQQFASAHIAGMQDSISTMGTSAVTVVAHHSMVFSHAISATGQLSIVTSFDFAGAQVQARYAFETPAGPDPVAFLYSGIYGLDISFAQEASLFMLLLQDQVIDPVIDLSEIVGVNGYVQKSFSIQGLLAPATGYELHLIAYTFSNGPIEVPPDVFYLGNAAISYDATLTLAVIPEPRIVWMLMLGLAVLVWRRTASR